MLKTFYNNKSVKASKAIRCVASLLFLYSLTITPVFAVDNSPAPIDKPALEKVRLQLKWFHQFQFAGYYAAIQQGYYAEEGLDVELIERDLSKSVVEQVINQEAEYGVGDSGLLHEYALNKPIVAMAAIFQHNPLVFMTRRDSGIISPFEFKGKRIMLDTLSANEAPLRALLAYSKVSDHDFKLVKQSDNNALLTEDKLDVMTGYISDEPFYYQQHNIAINIINPESYGIDFYGDILFTSNAERLHHPERIDRFLKASLKGWRYALDHPQELITLITNQYHSRLSLEHLQYEAKEILKLIPESVPLGYIDSARLNVLADTYVKAGYNQAIEADKLKKFVYQSVTAELNLSDAEKKWLAAHPVIRVGVNPNKQPYDWVDEQSQYTGMGADYLKLLEQKLGIHFTIVKPGASLGEILEMIKGGDLDMLAGVVITEQRENYLDFLSPYINSPNVIIDRGEQLYTSLDQLNGQIVAVEKYYAVEEWLKRDYPSIKILQVDDALSGLKLVENKKAIAYVGDLATSNYWIKKEDLADLKLSGYTQYRSDRTIAISKQSPELSSILNKASLMLDQQQFNDIPHHWLSLQSGQGISNQTIKKYALASGSLLFLFVLWIMRLNREVVQRKALEQREKRRNHVLDMLTNHRSLPSILDVLCSDVEKIDSQIACSILLVSEDGQKLLHGAAPSLPDFYCQAIDGLIIGPKVGSCGECAFRAIPVFVADILTHPNWSAFRELAKKLPYRACWSQPIKANNGELLGTFAIYHRKTKMPNIKSLSVIKDTAVLAAEAIEKSKLAMQTQLAAKVYSHAREGIYITDKKGNIIDCNEAFLSLSGYSREELLGKNPRIFKSGLHNEVFYSKMWQAILTEGFWSGEISNEYKDHKKTHSLHSITAIKNADNEIERFLAITTDISELKKYQQQLEDIAYTDTLTGLPNRLLLTDRLEQLILHDNREQLNLALAFIDLDGFKAINDNYGHDIGDQFLVEISQKMRETIRETDTLGRLGGDEFIVILNHQKDIESFHIPTQKLIDACSTPIEIHNLTLRVSASIGVTYYEGQTNREIDAGTLIRQADLAMYIAKQSGKDKYHLYDENTDQALNTRDEFIRDIELAIQENHLVLYYQPKVNMRTGELLGVEALIRWNHPQRGLLQPMQFLPMIENHPVGNDLGNWVLNQALSQIDRWQALGLNIAISINIDAKQLGQSSFIEVLRSAIAAYPNYVKGSLEIEVLETTAFDNRKQANLLITECKKLGIKFSIDDFGTGYSSLTYLKSFPIDMIKIDRSFIKDITTNIEDLAIVDSIISLGGGMGRAVIAEGVESIAIGEQLIKHGCEFGQGYVIAKPMPVEELLAWKEQWKPDASWTNA